MSDIREKIARLMAMGNDDRTNQYEAEAALRQAAKLMAQHNIDVAEISARTGDKPVYDWQSVNVPLDPKNPKRSAITWLGQLALGIGRFTDCKADYNLLAEHGMCIKFSGDNTDVQYAVWLFKHLRDNTRHHSRMHGGDRRDHESFRRAMVARLCERMRELLAERRADLAAAPTSTGTALVVVDQKIALRDAEFGKQRAGRSNYSYRDHAAEAGRRAGDKVGFGRPVGHTEPRRLGVQS